MKKNQNRGQQQAGKSTQGKQSRPRASAAQFRSKEFKLVSLRDCSFRDGNPLVETPKDAADYWRKHISTGVSFLDPQGAQVRPADFPLEPPAELQFGGLP